MSLTFSITALVWLRISRRAVPNRIDFRAGNGIIRKRAAGAGNKEEVASAFHMRIFSTRRGFAFNNMALDVPHREPPAFPWCHSRIQTLFSSE